MLNSIDVIEWNLNKKHILEFESKMRIPKTKLLPVGERFSVRTLEDIREELSVGDLVVKPAVSLNGEDTFLIRGDGDLRTIIHRAVQGSARLCEFPRERHSSRTSLRSSGSR